MERIERKGNKSIQNTITQDTTATNKKEKKIEKNKAVRTTI